MLDTSKSLSPDFFLLILDSPPGAIPAEVASTDVNPDEVTNEPEREAPVAVLETGNSKAGEHLSAAEVGSGKEPIFLE